jgi:hypothetical protein
MPSFSMRCRFKVDPTIEVCLNANCPSASGVEPPTIEQAYDIRATLLDHTGSLINCKLLDDVAAKMIGYKVSRELYTKFIKSRIKIFPVPLYCRLRCFARFLINKSRALNGITC